jgi:hypothetical protein
MENFRESGKTKADASHGFHLDISLTQDQIQKVEIAAAIAAGATCALVLAPRAKVIAAAIKESVPVIEDAANACLANAIKLTRAEPKFVHLQLKDGTECTIVKEVPYFNRRNDSITLAYGDTDISHRDPKFYDRLILNRYGERTFIKFGKPNDEPKQFFGIPGVGIHMHPPLSPDYIKVPEGVGLPENIMMRQGLISVLRSDRNSRIPALYKTAENCFWTGYTRPLERIPELSVTALPKRYKVDLFAKSGEKVLGDSERILQKTPASMAEMASKAVARTDSPKIPFGEAAFGELPAKNLATEMRSAQAAMVRANEVAPMSEGLRTTGLAGSDVKPMAVANSDLAQLAALKPGLRKMRMPESSGGGVGNDGTINHRANAGLSGPIPDIARTRQTMKPTGMQMFDQDNYRWVPSRSLLTDIRTGASH